MAVEGRPKRKVRSGVFVPKTRLLCVGRDFTVGGAERVQLTLLKHFDRDKFDIRIFYLSGQGTFRRLVPPDVIATYGVQWSESLKLRALPILVRLIKLARQSNVIFAMQEGTPIYLAVLAGRLTGRPVVGWAHAPWSEQSKRVGSWHRWALSLYSLTNKLIVTSEGGSRELVSYYPRLRGKVDAVRNPLPLQHIRTQARAVLPRWAEQVFTKRTVLSIGRLEPEKGFDILLPAFAELVHVRGLDLHLLILGDGEERARLEELARELEVSNRVFMPGFQQNPYPFFAPADVLVLSSRYEGQPVALLEAMALGLPVISTDCPHGPREITKEGRYGLLVPPDNVAALAEATYTLLNSAKQRAALSAAAATRVEEYDVSQVRSFEDLLLECVSNKAV
jgi:glycosyltransferase involved in cell wall biosynthesis